MLDPSVEWPEVHRAIQDTITELDGAVAPKLNWSAPKDATWIAATNSMECRTPNDVYLLLKSSDFITHDLERPFDDCDDNTSTTAADPTSSENPVDIPYALVLRKWVNINPSVEFRCFVRDRTLIGITQRDLNHFEFLFPMVDSLQDRIQSFFEEKLKDTFPDESFVFDVYVPPPHKRVWLMDMNPFAPQTDPLLFSWLELLQLSIPKVNEGPEKTIRLQIATPASSTNPQIATPEPLPTEDAQEPEDSDCESDVEDLPFRPEFRLIKRDDPEAYSFASPQYSAHKLPRDVVDASLGGAGPMRELADRWAELEMGTQQDESSDEEV